MRGVLGLHCVKRLSATLQKTERGGGGDAPCIPSERKSNQLDMKHSRAAGESVLFAETV